MKKRILLVSDMHYTTNLSEKEMRKIHPNTKASAASGDAFGHTQEEKIARLLQDILAEDANEKLDLVLVLGDLSIDDYPYRNFPLNYCEEFRNICMQQLPCPAYALPGNHDSHPNEIWKSVFGYDRQFYITMGDYLFVMLDNFQKMPATGASGAGYTQTDVSWLTNVLNRHPNKKVFLCSHMFKENGESASFQALVRNNPQIIALFRGHTHFNAAIPLGEEWGNKYLFDIGGYAYNGFEENGKWIFSRFDNAWAWGYQILEIDETIRTWHVKPAITYHASNGVFPLSKQVSEVITL